MYYHFTAKISSMNTIPINHCISRHIPSCVNCIAILFASILSFTLYFLLAAIKSRGTVSRPSLLLLRIGPRER